MNFVILYKQIILHDNLVIDILIFGINSSQQTIDSKNGLINIISEINETSVCHGYEDISLSTSTESL